MYYVMIDANGTNYCKCVIGGTGGYSYSWSDGQTLQNPAVDLIPATYFVIVTDSMNCTATSLTESITEPAPLYIFDLTFTAVVCNGDNTGTATVVACRKVLQITLMLGVQWSSNDVAPNLIAGNYTIQISDINGCSREFKYC